MLICEETAKHIPVSTPAIQQVYIGTNHSAVCRYTVSVQSVHSQCIDNVKSEHSPAYYDDQFGINSTGLSFGLSSYAKLPQNTYKSELWWIVAVQDGSSASHSSLSKILPPGILDLDSNDQNGRIVT